MKGELKEIEQHVILNKGTASFDTWGGKARSHLYSFLLEKFHHMGYNMFTGLKGDYIVTFKRGHNGKGGMDMGSPDSMHVTAAKPVEEWVLKN